MIVCEKRVRVEVDFGGRTEDELKTARQLIMIVDGGEVECWEEKTQ